ncbi:MAG: branched-chain amino acid ABC transporter substrate-binding protein [Pelovirga sp.]
MNKVFSTMMMVCVAVFMTAALASAETLKVGVQAPITGSYANEGQGIDNGTRLLANQINAAGGVMGRQIEVFTCDDQATAMASAICARELVNRGVKMIIGSYTSTAAEAAQKIYYEAGVLQTSDGTADSLTEKGYWTFFRNSFPNSAEAEYAAEYMVNHKGYERIVVISDFSSYAAGLAESTVDAIKARGGNVVAYDKIRADSQNFTPVLTNIRSMNPDVIFFAGYYTDGGQLRAQQMDLGIDADFIGGDANDNPDFIKLAGRAAEGANIINVPTVDMLPYDLAEEFINDYEEVYGERPPSIWGLMNIDGMRAIIHAMEQNQSFDTREAAEYLMNMTEPIEGITGPVQFSEDGNRVGSSYMTFEIQADGSYEVVHRQ